MKRIHLIISGRVQGVCFRYFVKEKAKQFKLKGWVKNNIGGTVEIIAEGDDENIESFLEYCKHGPKLSLVKDIKLQYENPNQEFKDFEIRF